MGMKKSGVRILTCVLVLASGSLLEGKVGENTKIYVVFVNQGCSCPAGGAPEGLITNEEVLHKLQDKCSGVDFIARDITKRDINIGAVLNELEGSKEGLDGVLILGALGNREYRLAFTGLPTICVYSLFEWMNIPYKLYDTGKESSIKVGGPEYKGGKILTAQLDRKKCVRPACCFSYV